MTNAPSAPRVLAPEVVKRQAIEKRIVRSFVTEMVAHGFTIRIDNGGDDFETPHLNNVAKIMKEIMATDEDKLYVFRSDSPQKAFAVAHFIYGNDGWDVLSDYHDSLDPLMPETLKLIDKEGSK